MGYWIIGVSKLAGRAIREVMEWLLFLPVHIFVASVGMSIKVFDSLKYIAKKEWRVSPGWVPVSGFLAVILSIYLTFSKADPVKIAFAEKKVVITKYKEDITQIVGYYPGLDTPESLELSPLVNVVIYIAFFLLLFVLLFYWYRLVGWKTSRLNEEEKQLRYEKAVLF
ncbi:MAG: hypothetical protein WBH73_03510 [Arcanobacterium sp.]